MKKKLLALLLSLAMTAQMTVFAGADDEYIEDVPHFDVIEDGEIITVYDEYTEDDVVIGEVEDEAEADEGEAEADAEEDETEEIKIIEENDVILGTIEIEAETFWSNGEVENNDTFLSDDSELVTVSGELPEDGRVVFSEVSNEFSELLAELEQSQSRITFDLNEDSNEKIPVWSGVYDIKILDSDNVEWQPTETVTVTIGNIYPNEHEVIEVYHYLNSAEEINAAMAAFENGEIEMGYYEAAELSELLPAETAAAYEVLGMEDCICYTVISSENGMVEINDDGSISFETNGFSIYKVSASFDVTASDTKKLIPEASNGGSDNVSIPVNDTVYYMWSFDTTISGDLRGVWSVTDGTDIIEITTYDQRGQNTDECNCTEKPVVTNGIQNKEHEQACPLYSRLTYQYWYVKVKALQVGTAKLKYTQYIDTNTSDKLAGTRTDYVINITVTESGYWIDDQISINGCLVPAGQFLTDTSISCGVWSKTKNGVSETIADDALKRYAVSNGVNVAVDKGGIEREDLKEKTYTYTAYDGNNNAIASASYIIKYGNEVLNGSFETPTIPNIDNDTVSHRQYTNGEAGLYLMTTGTGAVRNKSTDMLGHDIEIMTDIDGELANTYSGYSGDRTQNNSAYGQFGINKVADGHQAAELNCEQYGALYQDVITTPGATLNWTVAHAARYWTGSMGILSEEDRIDKNTLEETLQKIATGEYHKDDEGNFIKEPYRSDAAHKKDAMCVIIMSTEDARHVLTKNDIDTLLAAANYQHSEKHGTIENPVSGENNALNIADCSEEDYCFLDEDGNETNELTNISATINNQKVTFSIYLCTTDSFHWTLNTGTYKVPENQYLTRFFFAAVTSITNNLAGGNFIDNVSFSEDLTYNIEYHLQQANGQYVHMKDYDEGRNAIAQPVDTLITASCNIIKDYPNYALAYTELDGKNYKGNVSFNLYPSDEGKPPVLKVYYDLIITNLKIVKKGADVNLDPNQTFVFTVSGISEYTKHIQDLQVVIKGNGQVTIADLPIGQYTIKEESGWSWRYTPDAATKEKTIEVGADNTVTFTNTRKDIPWLDGNAYCVNTFKPNVEAVKFPDSENDEEEVNP